MAQGLPVARLDNELLLAGTRAGQHGSQKRLGLPAVGFVQILQVYPQLPTGILAQKIEIEAERLGRWGVVPGSEIGQLGYKQHIALEILILSFKLVQLLYRIGPVQPYLIDIMVHHFVVTKGDSQ